MAPSPTNLSIVTSTVIRRVAPLSLLLPVLLLPAAGRGQGLPERLLDATAVVESVLPRAIAALHRFTAAAAERDWQQLLVNLVRDDQPPQIPASAFAALQQRFGATQHGPFDDLILGAARRWALDPFLLKGLLANESRLEPVRVGKRNVDEVDGQRMVVAGGALGIAQFSGGGIEGVRGLRERRRRRGELAPGFDAKRALVPQEAIFAAAELLAHYIRRFGRDGGITAYNSGGVGGRAVARLGFWRARRSGRLNQYGTRELQGYRFLLNVLQQTNRLRHGAGLPPLPLPEPGRPSPRIARRDAASAL